MGYIPVVKDDKSSSDLFSKLLEDRIILVTGEVNEGMAELVMAQLLYLDNEDSTKDITMYINSGGGSVSAGLAIYDTMNLVKSDVSTVCTGMAASMGAVLLSNGKKGKRFITENSTVMIHQPLGGTGGSTQATDMEIIANRIMKTKKRLTTILTNNTNNTYSKVAEDCERDYWMDSDEALEYGIVDKIIY